MLQPRSLVLPAAIVAGLLGPACGRGERAKDEGAPGPAPGPRAGAVSGLAAAGGVSDVVGGPDARRPRIVRLGPMDGDVEILAGHPDSAGPFVMRIRELPGAIVPPHTHPVDEHITVVEGTWHFAAGERLERFDSTALTPMPAGTYAFAPKGATMFAWAPEGAIVQVHGMGPFHIHWRDGLRMLTDSGSAAAFRYRLGDAVTGARGAGRVRQGYVNGLLVQYEVIRSDGRIYMAREGDLRRP
jgi:hypothetical protein